MEKLYIGPANSDFSNGKFLYFYNLLGMICTMIFGAGVVYQMSNSVLVKSLSKPMSEYLLKLIAILENLVQIIQ